MLKIMIVVTILRYEKWNLLELWRPFIIIIIISLFSINPIESTSHGCGNRPGYKQHESMACHKIAYKIQI
jgi:hypothetical protein